MGCVASRIDKEERVQVCKERKRLMKQLVWFRGEFADALLAYLRAQKNTGVTLRQFTESESLELENTSYAHALPPSPPLPLPPSPPPPPPFSPDLAKSNDSQKEVVQQESMRTGEDDCSTPPPPSITSSSWWDTFEVPSPHHYETSEIVEPLGEEENWAETKTEFEEDDQEEEVVANSLPKKQEEERPIELVDDNSSMGSWYTKDTAEMAMVELRSKKTLEGIVKELDDYFLKASAAGKKIAVLMNISKEDTFLPLNFKENKRKRGNSAKIFTALSWSWSSKSLQLAKDAAEVCGPGEPCKRMAHCITLNKLYAAEQKLYKAVKEEEITKIELKKKSVILLKQEEENQEWTKIEKTRSSVEALDSDIRRLQHSISKTSCTISELIDEELYPQLVALISGLRSMWRTMYDCHKFQYDISHKLNYLSDIQSQDVTTDYHRQATDQLQNEVTCWYISFCKLMKSQQEYVKTLCQWIQLTNCHVDDHQKSSYSSVVRRLSEEWQLAFDRLPDKITSEAIKSLVSAIELIMKQQDEEYNLHKRSDKLEKRLEKELLSLAEMEKKLDLSFPEGDAPSELSPKHPLSLKHAKIEALKERVDSEKSKYLNSVQVTRAMTISNLKTSLPNVFQALMGFSSAAAQAFESVLSHRKPAVDASENSMS